MLMVHLSRMILQCPNTSGHMLPDCLLSIPAVGAYVPAMLIAQLWFLLMLAVTTTGEQVTIQVVRKMVFIQTMLCGWAAV